MSFDESYSTPGLIDSDSEDLPPTIQDLNTNIIDTSTPKDSHKDRGDATKEDTVVLETKSTDENKEVSGENAAGEQISIDSVGKGMPTPDEWTPPEWLSTPRGHSVYIYGWGDKRWNYDDYKEKVILCDYGFEFTTENRDEGSCVMRLKTDENEIHKCRWKMLGRRNEHDEDLHSDDEDGHGEDLHSGGDCVGEQELCGDDELCVEIEGIDRTKKYEVSRRPPYVYDSPLPDSEDADSSSGLKESSTNDEEEPSTNQDMNGMVVGNGQDEEEVEEGIITTSTDNVDDSEIQEDVSFMTLLEKADGASKMTMFIICFDEEIRRLQPGESGAEDQVGFPEDEEWRYTAVKHLRLAQVESTELEDGSYVILPNDNGEYEMTIFVDDPSDRKKPLEEKRFLYERHRMKGNRYFGEVEPSHIYYGEGVGPYTLPLNFSSMKYRVGKECVAIGPFTFDIGNKDEWVIPNEILQELEEVQEATGLGFGAPSKMQVGSNTRETRKRSQGTDPRSGRRAKKIKSRNQIRRKHGHLSQYDKKIANQMLKDLAISLTSPESQSRAMSQFVHAVARIVEVDAQGNKSTLLGDSNTFDSRKGGNETHAEQFLLDDMYSRLRLNIKEKRHEIATQYMILVLAQNMVCDGIEMDGSLCGNCVCALNKFHFLCGLDASKLKVITPRMPRQDETGDLKSISAVTKIKRRWEASELGEIDLTDVEYVPCTMNPHASPITVAVNGDTTVEDIIKEESKHYTSSEDLLVLHLPCCHFSKEVGKHRFEL